MQFADESYRKRNGHEEVFIGDEDFEHEVGRGGRRGSGPLYASAASLHRNFDCPNTSIQGVPTVEHPGAARIGEEKLARCRLKSEICNRHRPHLHSLELNRPASHLAKPRAKGSRRKIPRSSVGVREAQVLPQLRWQQPATKARPRLVQADRMPRPSETSRVLPLTVVNRIFFLPEWRFWLPILPLSIRDNDCVRKMNR